MGAVTPLGARHTLELHTPVIGKGFVLVGNNVLLTGC
jgi:hypothetical protein